MATIPEREGFGRRREFRKAFWAGLLVERPIFCAAELERRRSGTEVVHKISLDHDRQDRAEVDVAMRAPAGVGVIAVRNC